MEQKKPSLASYTTVFVVEYLRHGHRSPFSKYTSVENFHYDGVGLGDLTKKGMADMYSLGLKRRQEYVEGKRLVPYFYDP